MSNHCGGAAVVGRRASGRARPASSARRTRRDRRHTPGRGPWVGAGARRGGDDAERAGGRRTPPFTRGAARRRADTGGAVAPGAGVARAGGLAHGAERGGLFRRDCGRDGRRRAARRSVAQHRGWRRGASLGRRRTRAGSLRERGEPLGGGAARVSKARRARPTAGVEWINGGRVGRTGAASLRGRGVVVEGPRQPLSMRRVAEGRARGWRQTSAGGDRGRAWRMAAVARSAGRRRKHRGAVRSRENLGRSLASSSDPPGARGSHDDLTPEADYEATVRAAARRALRASPPSSARSARWPRAHGRGPPSRPGRAARRRPPVATGATPCATWSTAPPCRRGTSARVHAQFSWRWLVALQRADTPRATAAPSRRSPRLLRRAIAPDRNLDAIVTEFRRARVRDDLANAARPLHCCGPGARTSTARASRTASGTVLRRRWRASLRFRAYRVLDDAPVAVGARRTGRACSPRRRTNLPRGRGTRRGTRARWWRSTRCSDGGGRGGRC